MNSMRRLVAALLFSIKHKFFRLYNEKRQLIFPENIYVVIVNLKEVYEMINKYLKLYFDAVKLNSNLLVFPIMSGFLFFALNISKKTFDFTPIFNINTWIGSFATTFVIYMLTDILISRISFMKHHRYLFTGITFVLSTLIGECITFSVSTDFDVIRKYVPVIILDVLFIALLIAIGFEYGIRKSNNQYEIAYKNYKKDLESMPIKERKQLIKFCKKAYSLDEETFKLITVFKTKESINSFLLDLNSSFMKDNENNKR